MAGRVTTRSGRSSGVKREAAEGAGKQHDEETSGYGRRSGSSNKNAKKRPKIENENEAGSSSATASMQDESISGYREKVSMSHFIYSLPYKRLDLKRDPHLYRPGKGEQGVLMVEPFKSTLVALWKFKDPPTARKSVKALRERFDAYVDEQDFVGADMTRKFIQMGFTRARRYANHKGGRKYAVDEHGRPTKKQLPRSDVEDPVKAESAQIFKDVLEVIKVDNRYTALRDDFERQYKDVPIPIFVDEKMPTK